MGNAGLEIFPALRFETEAAVERRRLNLCVQYGMLMAGRTRRIEKGLQQRAADALPSPFPEHGHSADMAVREEPSGTDRTTTRFGEDMAAHIIEFVPFHFQWNGLLAHEHLFADCAQRRLVALPVGQPDPECF